MKAKDYYEKYKEAAKFYEQCNEEDLVKMVRKLLQDFCDEFFELVKVRKASTASAAIAILKELNKKWGAMTRLFKKHHGFSPFQEEAFKNVVLDQQPELREAWESNRRIR